MFDSLQQRLSGIFDTLTKRGALSEADVDHVLALIDQLTVVEEPEPAMAALICRRNSRPAGIWAFAESSGDN